MKKNVEGFLGRIGELTLERNRAVLNARLFQDIRRAILAGEIDQQPLRSTFDLKRSLRQGRGLIAEIKRASPSQGSIAPAADAVAIADDYITSGASAISVLTEPSYFAGSIDDLVRVRAAHPEAALLMKDFVVEHEQLYQARYFGADAVLLIAALLDESELRDFYAMAHELRLSVLVEIHDEAEFATAQALGSAIIGINNRNLKTLKTDLSISRSLAHLKKPGELLVAESGIEDSATIQQFRALGFEGFLVGTSLMRDPSPGSALRRFLVEP